MKKKILVAVSVIICILAIGVFVLAGRGFSTSTGLFLETENGDMIILNNSPIVMSARSGNDDMFAEYESGDKIFVIHDGIMETYPAKTGVYFSIKLADGHISNISEAVLRQLCELGWVSAENLLVSTNTYHSSFFDIITASTGSIFDTDKIKLAADNSAVMNENEPYHFPVFVFHTYESFRDFLNDFDGKFDSGHSNADDYREKFKVLNEEYFKENSVILVSYYTGSGNVSYDVENVYFDGENCCLNISQHTSGQGGTCAITSYLKAVGVEKSFLGDCNLFDAVMLGYRS